MSLHLYAVPQRHTVLVPLTPDDKALQIGRMILGMGYKSRDLWSQEEPLTAIKRYFERLDARIARLSRTTEDDAKAEFFGLMAADLEDDGIPGLQSFLARQNSQQTEHAA